MNLLLCLRTFYINNQFDVVFRYVLFCHKKSTSVCTKVLYLCMIKKDIIFFLQNINIMESLKMESSPHKQQNKRGKARNLCF